MLYTSVLLRVLVGKGYGVRASEYGLAPPTIQVRNIRTGNILFVTQFPVCIDDIRTTRLW